MLFCNILLKILFSKPRVLRSKKNLSNSKAKQNEQGYFKTPGTKNKIIITKDNEI